MPTQLDEIHRLTVRRVEWQGRLVEYAIVLSQLRQDGRWAELVCIDAMHRGSVHRHDGPRHSDPSRVLRPIRSQQDVHQSFDSSFDEVYSFDDETIEELGS